MRYIADGPIVSFSFDGFDDEQNRRAWTYVGDITHLREAETKLAAINKALRDLQAEKDRTQRLITNAIKVSSESRSALESELGRALTTKERECVR